jgi:hypothetical protein
MLRQFLIASLLWTIAGTAGVYAGTVLKCMNELLPQKGGSRTYEIRIDKGNVRMEIDGEHKAFIYRGDLRLFWIVDNDRNAYLELTDKDIETLGFQIKAAKSMLQSQLKNLTATQREKIGELLQAHDRPPLDYSKKESGEKINGMTCDKYAGALNGVLEYEIWTADPAATGTTPEDIAPLADMAAFFQKFAGELRGLLPAPDVKNGLLGLPIKIVHYAEGTVDWQTVVREITRERFPKQFFSVPGGFTKKTVSDLAR